ncbi:hypothetical protein ACFL2V_08870 [Pseudomonadota bacterium]
MKGIPPVFKPLILVSSITLAACGGGGGSTTTPSTTAPTSSAAIEISGTAEAPAGLIAQFENKSHFYAVSDFFFSPVAAAITGLQPVTGATVELIRIDDTGAQVGEVLATTATSITGDYKLTLPAGVDLSGDLIVRITGPGTSMSAQVVEQDVDINPISDFVLAKFIDSGADLDNLTTASVVKLSGQVEEFDLTATGDMATMLAELEAQTGDFIEANIQSITSTAGDGSTIAGSYAALTFDLGLHDDDLLHGVGTFSNDVSIENFSLSDSGSGTVSIAFESEEDSYTNQTFFAGAPETLTNNAQTDIVDPPGSEVETASFSSDSVLSGVSDFEEDVDGDFGWRFPASAFQFQKALNSDVFFGSNVEAGVRYLTVDTNDDNLKDAVDPNAREGDEVFRGLELVSKRPTAMSPTDLTGTFGVVMLALDLFDSGNSTLSVDGATFTFDGSSTLDVSALNGHSLSRNYGTSVTYNANSEIAENDIPFTVAANGDILTTDGENVDGFFNDSFDFFTLLSTFNTDDAITTDDLYTATESEVIYGVKLPTSQLDISNKKYKPIMLTAELSATATSFYSLGFNSEITVDGTGTSATGAFEDRGIFKSTMFADVSVESSSEADVPVSISVDANGVLTFSVTDSEGVFSGNGYMSHDGSIGLLHVRYTDTGSDPVELGLMFLVEVN